MSVRRCILAACIAWGSLSVAFMSGCGDETTGPPSGALSIQLAPTNSGDQQTGTVGTKLPQPLRVLVLRGSVPVSGIAVAWVANQDSLGTRGSLSADRDTTDASGIASVSWTLGTVAGGQLASAFLLDSAATNTVATHGLSASFTALAAPGPASRLRFSVDPTNVFVGRPIRPSVQVTVLDEFDNPTNPSGDSIAVALGAHPGVAILSGTTRVAAGNGVAAFVGLSIDYVGTGYTLIASANRVSAATSKAFDVVTLGSGEIAFLSARDGNSEIYLMSADGSGQVNLTNNLANDYGATWSPDGSKIAFISERNGNNEIYVMNADGSGQVNLTNNLANDYSATWSPDGAKIAFSSDRKGNGEIYVMNADGSGQVNLTNNVAVDYGAVWSRDGSKLAFSSDRDGNVEIYIMNADGSGQINVTNNPAFESSPTWSPDGVKIAFSSTRDGNSEIYAMNADGSGVSRLTNDIRADGSQAWSPDGMKIAFVRVGICRTRCVPPRDIYLMNADGSGLLNLTNNPVSDVGAAWSPDGSKIVFSTNRNGNYEIYVMNADGSGQLDLTNNPGYDVSPTWRP
jgi:Tol biopolymer transport system component